MSPSRRAVEVLALAGREVPISNPGKLYFPEAGITKLELVRYYVAVAEGALRGVRDRPMALKRYVVDAMRGRSTTWTRVRVNLRHVPDAARPAPEPPDPDYDPWGGDGAPKMRDSS